MEKKDYKVGYCKPPNRFSSTNQPKNRGHRGISLVSLLKKYLKKKIKYEDPETNLIIQGRVADAVVWRLILNATQGDNTALKEIFERIDGKAIQELIGKGFGGTDIHIYPQKVLIFKDIKEDDASIGRADNLHAEESPESNRAEGKI